MCSKTRATRVVASALSILFDLSVQGSNNPRSFESVVIPFGGGGEWTSVVVIARRDPKFPSLDMSTENQQNGTAGGAQSNGIKSSSSSSASSVASSGVSPSGRTAGLQNNTSFLYSSSTMLNREKARQVPPPTLPKYTSSFNAGSNGGAGTGGGTAERLSRDREAGGSYRLASLDRLALRQRILDGEKANGESISVSFSATQGSARVIIRHSTCISVLICAPYIYIFNSPVPAHLNSCLGQLSPNTAIKLIDDYG